MEKPTVKTKRQFSNRLLILFIFVTVVINSSVMAEKLNRTQLRNLQIIPESDTAFTQKDCIFTLTIPGVKPENVQTTMPRMPSHVQFVSSRRSDFIDSDRDTGTRIEFWFSFTAADDYTIPALTAVIEGRTYKLSFLPIHIYENPNTIMPQMLIKFSNSNDSDQDSNDSLGTKKYTLGQSIYFTVFLKYAVQVVKFDWELQKDSLFKELERFEITKGQTRGTEFSIEEIPVASFEWVPLTVGTWNLPEIKITATAYNGTRIDLITPSLNIVVEDSAESSLLLSKNNNSKNSDNVFAYAFAENNTIENEDLIIDLDEEICKKIAELRSAERNSLPFSKNVQLRREYESNLKIQLEENEPSVPLFYVCLTMSLLLLLFVLLMFAVHYVKIAVISCIFLGFFITGSIISAVKLQPKYAIFVGGAINPIPEEESTIIQIEQGGKRVRILEQTDSWIYILFNESGGWVSKDSVILIK